MLVVNHKLTTSLILAFIFSAGIILMSSISNIAFGGSPSGSLYNFGAAGDWGCNSNTGKTTSTLKDKNPDRVFGLGDYSYLTKDDASNPAQCWLDRISSIKSITRPATGNHEDDDDEGYSNYQSAFGFSKPYFAFTFNGGTTVQTRVIVMDSDRNSYSVGSSQYNFVLSELKKTGYKWKIVYIHKEMYTSPNTCSASDCSNSNSGIRNLRSIYHPLFDQYGVDLVLNGHLHNYQRTFPIKYDSGSPDSPTITSTSSSTYSDPSGAIFVTVGTGGVNLHGLSNRASFVKYQQDDFFGGLDVSIENNGDTLAARYYTNDGVRRDTFYINKPYTTASYAFGPSLSLSGQAATTIVPSEDGSLGIVSDGLDKKSANVVQPGLQEKNDNNVIPGQSNGQGEGLDCEHFFEKGLAGPTRCRDN
jgi:hypothetical protein